MKKKEKLKKNSHNCETEPYSTNDGLLPIRVVWEGLSPFLKQAGLPEASLNDRSIQSPLQRKLFSYSASDIPFNSTIKAQWNDRGLVIEVLEYQTGPLTRATAFIIKPKTETKIQLPGLLLFHCHSGVYQWGKEKVLATSGDSEELKIFRRTKYDGRSIAHDFAEKGFIVMVPDSFYFGSRALGEEGIDSPWGEIDRYRKNSEDLVAKMLLLAGHSWPAIIAWEDRRALDFLCTIPEVDQHRIGCAGLSSGVFGPSCSQLKIDESFHLLPQVG